MFFKNHLDSTPRLTYSDIKRPDDPTLEKFYYTFKLDYLSATTTYPFGAEIEELSFENSQYRFGFTGHLKDNIIRPEKGDGANYSTLFREYDPIIGRWWSIDPERGSYSNMSPYNYCMNIPVQNIDPDGGEPKTYDHVWAQHDKAHQLGIKHNFNPDLQTSNNIYSNILSTKSKPQYLSIPVDNFADKIISGINNEFKKIEYDNYNRIIYRNKSKKSQYDEDNNGNFKKLSNTKLGKTLKGVGRIYSAIGWIEDGENLIDAIQKDGGRWGSSTTITISEIAGERVVGWGSMLVGARTGAYLGAPFGLYGEAIGGFLGGATAGIVGSGIGKKIGNAIINGFNGIERYDNTWEYEDKNKSIKDQQPIK